MGTHVRELRKRLYAVAVGQGGLFTSAQAIEAGYKDSTHGYHVRNGDWERLGWGIYRLCAIAVTPWSEIYRILLWSRGRDGISRAVFCGKTAAAIQTHSAHLLDINHIEVCLPKGFRRSAPFPSNAVPFFEDLCKADVILVEGIPITHRSISFSEQIIIKPKKYGWWGGERVSDFDRMVQCGED